MNTIRHLSSAGVLTVLVSTVAVGPAAAQPDEHEKFHLTFSDTLDCDGTTIRQDLTADGNFKSDKRPDGTIHEQAQSRNTNLFTNVENGKTITETFTSNFNGTITPNAFGGLTRVQVFPGNDRWVGPDGKLIGHLAGAQKEVLVFDQDGVPVSIESTFHGNKNPPISGNSAR